VTPPRPAEPPAREPVAAQAQPAVAEAAKVPAAEPAPAAQAAPSKPRPPARERVQLPAEQEMDYLEPESLGGVNLNTANVEQILTLSGVTPLLAQTIVDYRGKNGPFKSVFDLINVPRLGRGTFRKLTGMPFSENHLHRRRKLAMLLGIPASKVGDLPEVAAAIVRVPGLAGCVISDGDGMLLTEAGASGFAAAMSAVVPKMFRQMYECMAVVSVGNVKSVSLCIDDRMFTIIASERLSLTVVHETSKLTKAQIVMIQKIAEELGWLLSHRAYVGKTI
jgi:competence ComEA-like helix-hairpin-helix protein